MDIHRYVTDRDAIARALGRSFAPPEAGVSAVIVPIGAGEPQDPIAAVLDIDPLTKRGGQRSLDAVLLDELKTDCIIAWSGSLGDQLFARDIHTWGPTGRQAFGAMVDRLRGSLVDQGKRLLLRPHCRHILSDAQRMLSFMLEEEQQAGESPFGLAIDPVSLLEPTMLGVAGDHVERSIQALGGRADLVILTGVAAPQAKDASDASAEGPLVRATSVHDGMIDPARLGALVSRYVPAATPVVLLDLDLDEQLEALDLACPQSPGA